ncbi:dienelactone hydrolase family protein [Nocardioides panacisoli]|uniref:dienelactone hydrolase family protein n=1 Tax=Nocardioides panacisoli TaxID=627624 RepID=UPI001C62E4EE|nr:dienelactone hydrolase family protein [Nocardioides panacisoli]QYJ03596.1 dienelactone hydrolase family protein [Nocardioides panacisoli]
MSEAQSEHNVEFQSNGTTAFGYLEKPAGGSGPGVIVIQEWWGLTTHIADVTKRLAGEGFVALAPDLYGNRVTHDGDEAAQMMQDLDANAASKILSGAIDYLTGLEETTSSSVGAIGFCMGGGFVLSLAQQAGDRVSAAVPFYGFPQGVDLEQITADVQGHYAREDEMLPIADARDAFRRLESRDGATTEFFEYDAGHAFFNDEDLIGTYDADKAAEAWGRATTFLRDRVR